MRILISLIILFPMFVRAQSYPAPENPVAISFLLKHTGLKGQVKKITVKDSTGTVIRQEGYDINGRLTRILAGTGRYAVMDDFSYDTVARYILQKKQNATGEKFVYKYQYNTNGDVTTYYISNQAGNMFYTQRSYVYQGNLLVHDSAYIPSASAYYSVYQYNGKNQVVNSKTFTQKTKILLAETTYEYKMQDGLPLVKIQEKKDYSGNGKFETATSIKYYDKNWKLIKEQNIGATAYSLKPRELTYKLDAGGNWISNSKKETREIEYYPAGTTAGKEPVKSKTQ